MSSDSDLNTLRESYATSLLMSAAYGAYMVIVVLTCYLLCSRGRAYRGRNAMLAYTALMWVLTSVWLFTGERVFASAFVDTRLSSSPRLGLIISSSPEQLTPEVAAMLQMLASDGALLYRAYVLWEGNIRVMGPLFLFYFVQTGSGISRDVSRLYEAAEVVQIFNLIMNIATLVLNLLATVAIVCRIRILRRRTKTVRAKRTDVEQRAVTTAALLAGSAAFYTVCGGVYQLLSCLGLGGDSDLFGMLWQISVFMSPALIILHVVMGVALNSGHETMERDPPQYLPSNQSPPDQGSKWVPGTCDEKAACVDQPVQFTGPSAV